MGLADLTRWLACGAIALTLVACGSDAGSSDGNGPSDKDPDNGAGKPGEIDPATADEIAERPWEIVSKKGETYVPNVFYADASQNEQIMPYGVGNHVMIDRMIYPTIGNPNLYTRSDETDELLIVTRLEDEAYAFLAPKIEAPDAKGLSKLELPKGSAGDGFAFLLISRPARATNTDSVDMVQAAAPGIFRIHPTTALVSPIPKDMPEVLKARKTIRFVFDHEAMAKVPPGLYDLRLEIRKNNDLHLPKAGGTRVYEYQYNAVRVFDKEPDELKVVNVTDTQVSIGSTYDAKTKEKLEQFVTHMATTNDPNVTGASFITFNGDLHNGGSPGSLRSRIVATTYASEAKIVIDNLKQLPLPIFLTTGNHDGYVATGQIPSAIETVDSGLGDSLEEVVNDANPKAWPNFSMTEYKEFLRSTEESDRLGGNHVDIFTGSFARTVGRTFTDSWKEIPRKKRNFVLYDGLHQWQKTYGPLHYSHKFGKGRYVSLDSFELRQHRRTGWGMYTVNYGGGMSAEQMGWLDRELTRAKIEHEDVVLLAHHDPRGGHKGTDFGFYFEQLEYRSIYQSAINYAIGKYWNPVVCKFPDWALPREQTESCVHDGLQEWMRADEEFDCDWTRRTPDFTCDGAWFGGSGTSKYFLSGMELMKRIAQSKEVRTVILGHTHYNELEMLQGGDQLLPNQLPLDGASVQKYATWEVQNPIRAFSVQSDTPQARGTSRFAVDYNEHALTIDPIERSLARFSVQYEAALPGWSRVLEHDATPRELMILRLVSNADITGQTTSDGKTALGYSVFEVTKRDDARAMPLPQINAITFYVNIGSNDFMNFRRIELDRTARIRPKEASNPVDKIYKR